MAGSVKYSRLLPPRGGLGAGLSSPPASLHSIHPGVAALGPPSARRGARQCHLWPVVPRLGGASPDSQLCRKPKLISAPWNPSLHLSPMINELPSKGGPRNLSHSAVSFRVVLLHSCSPILPTGDGPQPTAWHLLHP